MSKLSIGITLFIVGNVLAWYQFNSQFVWEWFAKRPMLTNVIFCFPFSVTFYYAIKYTYEASGELWTTKLIGFGASNIVFAVLTYAMMKESIFSAKTMTCLALSVVIIAIQVLWK